MSYLETNGEIEMNSKTLKFEFRQVTIGQVVSKLLGTARKMSHDELEQLRLNLNANNSLGSITLLWIVNTTTGKFVSSSSRHALGVQS